MKKDMSDDLAWLLEYEEDLRASDDYTEEEIAKLVLNAVK